MTHPRILIISDMPLFPQVAGNRARMLNMFDHLREVNADLHFIHLNRIAGDSQRMADYFQGQFHEICYVKQSNPNSLSFFQKIDSKLRRDSYAYNQFIDDSYDDTINQQILKISDDVKPDIVLVEYVMMTKVLRHIDASIHTIVDTHDVFANRYQKFLNAGLKPNWFSAFPADEIRHLRRASTVIAIQSQEAKYFRRSLGDRVSIVGHLVRVTHTPMQDTSLSDRRVLFVGGDSKMNLDAMNFFVNSVWPAILAERPQAELVVAGAICNAIESPSNTIMMGTIANIQDAYQAADVVVNPCQWGTGLKTKNVEALAMGKALVTTRHGAIGLHDAPPGTFASVDSAEEFARSVVRYLSTAELRATTINKSLMFAESYYNEQVGALRSAFKI